MQEIVSLPFIAVSKCKTYFCESMEHFRTELPCLGLFIGHRLLPLLRHLHLRILSWTRPEGMYRSDTPLTQDQILSDVRLHLDLQQYCASGPGTFQKGLLVDGWIVLLKVKGVTSWTQKSAHKGGKSQLLLPFLGVVRIAPMVLQTLVIFDAIDSRRQWLWLILIVECLQQGVRTGRKSAMVLTSIGWVLRVWGAEAMSQLRCRGVGGIAIRVM